MDDTLTAETPATEAASHAEEHHTSTGISNEKLAMWVFLGSECLLFGGLISTYMFNKGRIGPNDIGPSDLFDIPFTSVSSFVLLMSSLTMVFAVSAVARGDIRGNRIWLATTAALGATFVAGQVYEFTAFYSEGLGFTTNLFGSAFYALTGFHGAHVTIGIIMLMSLFVMSMRGNLGPERAETVEIIGLYWHFVDVVWIVIFTIVYLFPQ
ncbi:cytochrome c oxidase subunit 3 [Candidatus Poriferisocius sp.]|uniref:cytochrome c oxidase subunit 3 n=1 Tax=Candidatus Poriferisocius sp. TaxID=3101276 RepID=UPI003B525AC1